MTQEKSTFRKMSFVRRDKHAARPAVNLYHFSPKILVKIYIPAMPTLLPLPYGAPQKRTPERKRK